MSGAPHPKYFIRNDDIGELTPALRQFVSAFIEAKLPVSYQIIPALLSKDCARYLLEIEREHPHLIEFGQHGLRHRMSLRGKELRREFGPERGPSQQTADIIEGLQLLRQQLGERDITLFTPPQHKFDRHTVAAAANAGHKTFSAACYPTAHHRLAYSIGRLFKLSSIRHHGISYHGMVRPEADLREISISIAIDNGRKVTCPAALIPDAIKRAARHTNVIGFMFHHEVYTDRSDQLKRIIDELMAKSQDSFHLLGNLARAEVQPSKGTPGY